MSKRIPKILKVPLLTGILLSSIAAQNPLPLQVELVRAVDAAQGKVGDAVLAKAVVKWQNPQCTLREGAILNGRIVTQIVHSKTEKISQLALLFDTAQCDGVDMKPLPMTVAAVLAKDPSRDREVICAA
jgi:hypothetical protein